MQLSNILMAFISMSDGRNFNPNLLPTWSSFAMAGVLTGDIVRSNSIAHMQKVSSLVNKTLDLWPTYIFVTYCLSPHKEIANGWVESGSQDQKGGSTFSV